MFHAVRIGSLVCPHLSSIQKETQHRGGFEPTELWCVGVQVGSTPPGSIGFMELLAAQAATFTPEYTPSGDQPVPL